MRGKYYEKEEERAKNKPSTNPPAASRGKRRRRELENITKDYTNEERERELSYLNRGLSKNSLHFNSLPCQLSMQRLELQSQLSSLLSSQLSMKRFELPTPHSSPSKHRDRTQPYAS
jgi:hypothetical protein